MTGKANLEKGAQSPGYDNAFRRRFGTVIGEIGQIKDAAVVAGCRPEQIAKWRDGAAKVPLFAAAALCQAVGRRLDWLVDGNENQGIDADMLAKVITWTEETLEEEEIAVPSEKKADLFLALYEIAQRNTEDGDINFDELSNVVRLFK